ncbi:hypothetical protein [Curvivirga sp.]|uniref:hypothetical protein n=1 Tax=Curvivirga sp. TaxID=2856848 RepID=UPI003B59416E
MGIDIIWWITAVELPALAALFWMNWRSREELDNRMDELDQRVSISIAQARESLAAYKLEVAKSYVTISYLKDVERRLTGHLLRIESKLTHHPAEGK